MLHKLLGKKQVIISGLFFFTAAGYLSPAITVKETPVSPENGFVRITVKNPYFEMDLVPTGAQAVTFKTRYSSRPWLWEGAGGIKDTGHLFMDNFLGQVSPGGELCFIKHEYEILKSGPEEVEIAFHATTKEKLLFRKTFLFTDNSPAVKVTLSLTNESNRTIVHGLWPKMEMHVSGLKEKNRYYRPYEHGVLVTGWDPEIKANTGEFNVWAPTAGWSATLHDETQEGLVFLIDYNWLKNLYNCHPFWTVEWFYDDVQLAPGQNWKTEYSMILVNGFRNVAHASGRVITGMQVEAKQKFDLVHPDNPDRPWFLQITHTLNRSTSGDLKNVKLSAVLKEVDTEIIHHLPDIKIGDIGWEAKQVVHRVEGVNTDIRILCRVTLTGRDSRGNDVKEEYEYYWPGKTGEKFNLVAGKIFPTYERKPPRKVKEYPKPKDLKYTLNRPSRAFEFRGLGYSKMRISEALARAGIGEIKGSYFSTGWMGDATSYVPQTFEEFFQYDIYILNNVSQPAVTDFTFEALRDFVKAGGNLLVIGGLYTYGRGGFKDTQMEELLPVTLPDTVWSMEKLEPPAAVSISKEARILKDMSLGKSKPYAFWRHKLMPKPDAWTELYAGDNPLLVIGRYGKGRVAAITSGPLGEGNRRQIPYWESPGWIDLLTRLVKWMVYGEVAADLR